MKASRLLTLAALTTFGLGLALPALAQDNGGKAKPERPAARQKEGAQKGPAREGPREGPRQGPQGPMMNFEEHIAKVQEFLQTLDLTDAQKTQIKEIVADAKEKWTTWRDAHKDDLEKVRADMKAAAEAKDREKMQAAREAMQELMKDAPKPGEAMEKIRDVLTPEQKEKLSAKLAEMREKMQERREKMQEHRGEGKGEGKGPGKGPGKGEGRGPGTQKAK